VISCGSYNGSGAAGNPITLGYEPQWVLTKRVTAVSSWYLQDIMRGMPYGSDMVVTSPNTSSADSSIGSPMILPTATGFQFASGSPGWNGSGDTYIYIAIRRGPMAVPTLGTTVYNAIVRNGTGAVANVTGVGFSPDLIAVKNRTAGYDSNWVDKLRGALPNLASSNGAAEVTDTTTAVTAFGQDGVTLGDNNIGTYGGAVNYFPANSYVNWFFKRAPVFFDEVCYSGSGSSPQVLTHNLTVTPEMMIVKNRGASTNWYVYHSALGNTKAVYLEQTSNPVTSAVFWNDTSPTSTQFTVGAFPSGAGNYVTYLFATCPGVSKVGSYTGTGAAQTVNCGFTTGARFVLIRRTSAAGSDWYVWDSARGIIPSNDPYLLLNSATTETTGTDYVDTTSVGFDITSTAPAAINASGGTFIFLAIA
jgi:hypothetical protein